MPDPIEIPPQGTRGAWVPWGGVVMRILKPVMNLQIARYRRTAGPTPPEMMGFPVVLLTTVGARTGHEHTTVLGGFQEGDGAWIVVASKSGASSHPHWFFNLAKNPARVWLEVGHRKITASLAAKFAVANNYHAVSHPSVPNYLALTSGSTWGVQNDSYHVLPKQDLGTQLTKAGVSWRAYMEGLTSAGCLHSPVPYDPGH